jgi:hypothetical protein
LELAVGQDVAGATVTTARPDGNGNNTPTKGVNIFLYQVTPNPSWRNADLPTRAGSGALVQRPRAALDLHYILTHYGNEETLEPQRLLGSVVSALHTEPVLTRRAIRETIQNQPFSDFLGDSDLDDEVELVKFTPSVMSLEDLSKLWSVFFQAPYNLSVAYQATVVFIEPRLAGRMVLPVLKPQIFVVPFRQPVIEQVVAQVPPDQRELEHLIFADSTLLIKGQQLGGTGTKVFLAGEARDPSTIADTQVAVALSGVGNDELRAGVQGVQVVQPIIPPFEDHPVGYESNVAAFVLRPKITVGDLQVTDRRQVTQNEATITLCSGSITLGFEPKVGRRQRVVLSLNEKTSQPDATPRAYSFATPSREAEEPQQNITIGFVDVAQGTYFVRAQVDGAESLRLKQVADEQGKLVYRFDNAEATIQ